MNQQATNKNILILYASPHKNSHTAKLVQAFLSTLPAQYSSKWISITDPAHIKPCIDCKVCKNGLCPFNHNDIMESVIHEIQLADYVILASPIYFAGFPSVCKAMIDRSQQFFDHDFANRNAVFPQKKPGFLFLTAGSSDPLVNQSMKLCTKMFFNCMNLELSGKIILENTDSIEDPDYDFKEIQHFFTKA